MRLRCVNTALMVLMASAVLLAPWTAWAATCTPEPQLGSLDRDALSAILTKVANALTAQDESTLQAVLLPQEASQWDGIRATVEQAAPLLKGGHFSCGTSTCSTRASRQHRRIRSSSARMPQGR